MTRKLGMISSAVTLFGVLGFAVSMLLSFNEGSYLFSMFIAWGFLPLIASLAVQAAKENKAFSVTSVGFAAVYVGFIMLVYFAQLTAVSGGGLSREANDLLNYETFGLFFSYDLLGYAFMALATFFAGFSIRAKSKGDRWLKGLLLVHGIFAPACVTMPLLGIFQPDMPGGELIGVLVLEVWCAYFTPVCILALRYFRKSREE